MNTTRKIIVGTVTLAALGIGGYFLWNKYGKKEGFVLGRKIVSSEDDEDDENGEDGEDKENKLDVKAQKMRNTPKMRNAPKPLPTEIGGESVAEWKTPVNLPTGTYLVDRKKVLYYDGNNSMWPSSLKGQPYNPDTIKKKFIPTDYRTWQLLPADEEQYAKLVERYKKDVAGLDRQWAQIIKGFPKMASFDGGKKRVKKSLVSAVDDRNFVTSNY